MGLTTPRRRPRRQRVRSDDLEIVDFIKGFCTVTHSVFYGVQPTSAFCGFWKCDSRGLGYGASGFSDSGNSLYIYVLGDE